MSLKHALLPLALAVLLGATGCGNKKSSSSAASGSTSSGSTNTGSSAPPRNQVQWQTALAALALAQNPDPVFFDGPSVAAYNDLIAENWPFLVPRIRAEVEGLVQASVGQALSGLSIVSISRVTLDAAAPPALGASAPGPFQTLDIFAPRPPRTWTLTLDATVGGTVPLTLFGVTTQIAISVPLTLTARDVALTQSVDLDLRDPDAIAIASVAPPQVGLRLELTSPTPLVSNVAGLITNLLDPIVRAALIVGAQLARQQIGLLLNTLPNGAAWGRGGPGVTGLASPPDLEGIALGIADQNQTHQLPHGNLYPTVFDQPNVGGQVTGYRGHGDSALWTGGYLASEAYKYEVLGDPRVEAVATRILNGYDIQTRVTGNGLLARTAMPLSSPWHATIAGYDNHFTGWVGGVQYGALGDTSRDSYTGTMFGLSQTWLRVPALRSKVTPIVDRLLEHLEANGWMVHQAQGQPNNPTGTGMSVTFAQAPLQVLAFSTLGSVVNPTRWAPLRARYADLSGILWFNAWASSHEVHEGYFKFNLGHMNLLNVCELETDPARYRDYLKVLRVLTGVVEHHQNPWFEAARASILPPAAATLGPQIRAVLERWTLRPRRGFTIRNSQDPTIAHATYTTTLPNQSGTPQQPLQTGTRSWDVAVYPVPIEKRPPSSFIFSSSPFDLDGAVNPHEQPPGNDFLLPYWIARNHNVIAR